MSGETFWTEKEIRVYCIVNKDRPPPPPPKKKEDWSQLKIKWSEYDLKKL